MIIFNAILSRDGIENGVDDYVLRMHDISDHLATSLVKHEFIGTDGALITPLGNRARTVRFRAFFYGPTKFLSSTTPGTDCSYENHYQFIGDMENSSTFHVLIHPKYGRIEGYVESMQITHDDTQEYVTIDIDFVEKDIQIRNSQIIQLIQSKGAFLSSVSSLNSALKNSMLDKIAASISSSGFGAVVGVVIDTTKNVQTQIKGATKAVNDFLGQVDAVTHGVDNFLSNVSAPFDTLNNAVQYTASVPSKILASFNNCANRILASVTTIEKAPFQAVNSAIQSFNTLSDTVSAIFGNKNVGFWQPIVTASTAGNIMNYSAVGLNNDQTNRQTLLNMEKQPAFNIAGVRVNKTISTITDVMSKDQVENLLYAARQTVQIALNADRSQLELKQMVNIVTQFVDQIKLTSQSVVTMSVNSTPLHMLMLQLGLDYHAAERVLKLNPGIKNPTFTEGTVKVYVQ